MRGLARRAPPPLCARLAAALLLAPAVAAADPPAEPMLSSSDKPAAEAHPAIEKLDTERFEWAAFPLISGNSDIGVQFGGAGTLTRFHGNVAPYLWNLDLVLSASLKNNGDGVHVVQQSHVIRIDAPYLLGGLLRIDARGNFQRTINQGYYGLGDASSAALPAGQTIPGQRYEYLQQEARLRVIGRVHTKTPWDFAFLGHLRLDIPETYTGSKLAEDAAAANPDGTPVVRGLDPAVLFSLAAGVMYDTRDTEFVTTRGLYYQLGLAGTLGTADAIRSGEASAVLAHYYPIVGPFLFAARVVVSMQFGHVAFYDLQQGGALEPQYLFGSESGVRGIPQGRYAGLAKGLANIEVRSTLPRFHLFGQRFRFGTTTFFDFGRVWNDYRYDPARDGRGLGMKFGVGGGAFLQWGEAAIFRIEAAYSPDAVAENPGFPVGIYVSDGLMF